MAILAAVLAIAVVAAGCGSSDSDDSSSETAATTQPLTKAQFVKRATAICFRSSEQINEGLEVIVKRVGNEKGGLEKPETQAELVKVVLPSMKVQGEELEQLEAPEGVDEAKVEELTDAIAKAVEEGEAAEDPAAVLEESSTPFQASGKIAKSLGIEGCGRI